MGSRPAAQSARLLLIIGILAALLLSILPPPPAAPPRRPAPFRVIVLGFDGMDADLTEQWLAEGRLPNLRKLALAHAGKGLKGYSALHSSNPSESPVSWSSMITGMNPGKTNMYDFLRRHPETYSIDNAMVDTSRPAKFDPLFKAVPLAPPRFRNYRIGEPLWSRTARAGIRTVVLEAPVSFPPDQIPGGQLICGLGVADIRGTQGTYTFYTTDPRQVTAKGFTEFGGRVKQVFADSNRVIQLDVIGPPNRVKNPGGADSRLPVDLTLPALLAFVDDRTARLTITLPDGTTTTTDLAVNTWSGFIELHFQVTEVIAVHGICRARLTAWDWTDPGLPQVGLYLSPISFDPRNPPLPISYPAAWSKELAAEHGLFKTVGWPSETWGLNERVLDEVAFLEDIDETQALWEQRLFSTLARDDWDFLFAVTQHTDHVSHMFWRFFDPTHPAYDEALAQDPRFRDAILHSYQRADRLVGRLMEEHLLDDRTILLVVSDHGFNLFRRAVNINRWLINNGFMALRLPSGQATEELSTAQLFAGYQFFQDVDWSKTKAYAMGLGQIYLNLQGREGEGIVAPGTEAESVKRAIREGLLQMRDPENGKPVMREVYDGAVIYHGDQLEQAPDLVMGFADGYRVSWQTSLGGAPLEEIEDNNQPWSGDHCSFDPEITLGVCFTNWTLDRTTPSVKDIVPTVLRVFGLPMAPELDGEPLFVRLPGE